METTKKPLKPSPAKLRERAVLAEKVGCAPETLRSRVRQARA